MKKIWLVFKQEIFTLLLSKSFWFGTVGIPLISSLIFGIAGAIHENSGAAETITSLFTSPPGNTPEGYVDQSGLLVTLPANAPTDRLIAFPTEAAARQALASGEISAFYIIPADYIATGRVSYIRPEFNPLSESGQGNLLRYLLRVNLLSGDVALAERVERPLNLRVISLATEPQRQQDNPMTFFLPYMVTMLFYIIILSAASLLLSSVTKEKENRVMEVLMSSITPIQMLTGKITGLGVIGLAQMVLWVGTGFALLRLSGSTFDVPEAFQLPTSFLIWALIFFLLGYAVYAALMAGLGALVPNLREASQATIVVVMPLIVPLILISVLIENSDGWLAVVLSLFPLTSPVAMMTRLAAGNVPIWQPILAAVLLAITAVIIVRAVAGMFRAQALLSGTGFNLKVFLAALIGRA